MPTETDGDGDGILNTDEGKAEDAGTCASMNYGSSVDTDGDGIADYCDTDSDNDTIFDRFEGLRQTDDDNGDGVVDARDTPDFRDTDSDGDGLLDIDEAHFTPEGTPGDTDGDGIFDFRDPDSDNDGLADSQECAQPPSACGNRPSSITADTDGDGITDVVEVNACPSGGTITFRDVANNEERTHDCTSDAVTAVDMAHPYSSPTARGDFFFVVPPMEAPSPPSSTLTFAMRIKKADVYFLLPAIEAIVNGDTVIIPDVTETLVNGLPDLVTALRDPATGIPDTWIGAGKYGDYPSAGCGVPVTPVPSTFTWNGSLRNLPSWACALPSGCGITPHTETPFYHVADVANLTATELVSSLMSTASVYHVGYLSGEDTYVAGMAGIPALFAISEPLQTGRLAWSSTSVSITGCSTTSLSWPPGAVASRSARRLTECAGGSVGYPCFRRDAAHVVVLSTVVPLRNAPNPRSTPDNYHAPLVPLPPSFDATVDSLRMKNIFVIGLSLGRLYDTTTDLRTIAERTSAIATDATGTTRAPIVYRNTSLTPSSLSADVVRGIRQLGATRMNISLEATDATGGSEDAVDTLGAFVDSIERNLSGTGVCLRVRDQDGMLIDGTGRFPDAEPVTFPDFPTGGNVCFDIHARQNDPSDMTTDPSGRSRRGVAATSVPQIFTATLRIMGNDTLTLSERRVYFLVPARIRSPENPL